MQIFALIVTEEIGKAIGSKSGYSSVAIALQDHRDDCAQLYQAARSAADELWGSLQKVLPILGKETIGQAVAFLQAVLYKGRQPVAQGHRASRGAQTMYRWRCRSKPLCC